MKKKLNALLKKLVVAIALVAGLKSQAVNTTYNGTNDLGLPFNVSFFYLTNGAYSFGTNVVVAAGGTPTLTQTGTNWSGVTLQSTNGGFMTGAYFTNIGATGGKFSLILSNDFYVPIVLWSGTAGSMTASNAFATNVPGSITGAGVWTNSSH